MTLNRRSFLLGISCLGLTSPLLWARANSQAPVRFYSARADHRGRYYLTALDASGRLLLDVPLPGRGHGLAVHPLRKEVAVFARRPGRFLMVIDIDSGRVVHQVESAVDRHFFGHGVFSRDGRWLYTTENDLGNDRGVIGVRDTEDGYRLVAELPSHGIGPHELKLTRNGRMLVVANGGILTRPETGRTKLNLDSMSPSLAYIDPESGNLRDELKLPKHLHKNSIRHLAINDDDTICIGMQFQGSSQERPPLVGLQRPGEAIRLLAAPAQVLDRMHNYCGSVTVDSTGQVFAISSPRGNLVTFWSAKEGAYLGHTDVTDGCGIAATGQAGEYFISSGKGEIIRYRMNDKSAKPLDGEAVPSARWDNHMI